MRLIVIDVGNTSTAVGLWIDGRVRRVSHCDGGFEEAERRVAALAEARCKADAIAYVSVVPDEDEKWAAFAARHGLRLHAVCHGDFRKRRGGAGLPPVLDYPEPESIGADRLADAAGAVFRYGAPVLVMDFGTALTAAVITADGVWRGGVIAPGFPLMRDYLFERTAKLPRMEIGRGKVPKIGRSTEGAMRFGAIVGYRGMVREIVAELRRNFGQNLRIVATGGFAGWVLKDMGLAIDVDSTLTLFGAGRVAAERIQRK